MRDYYIQLLNSIDTLFDLTAIYICFMVVYYLFAKYYLKQRYDIKTFALTVFFLATVYLMLGLFIMFIDYSKVL